MRTRMKTVNCPVKSLGLVGDIHIGTVMYNNGILTEHHNAKRAEFFDAMLADFKERGVDTILFAGDVFDCRGLLGVQDIHYAIDLFANKMKDFHVITIVGNHDMLYENSDTIHSLEMLKYIPNVDVVDEPTCYKFFDDSEWYLFPWLGTDENVNNALELMKSVGGTQEQRARNVFFGHFNIIGIPMESGQISKSGFDPTEITKYCHEVISGHYHCKSARKIGNSSIIYLGSPYHLSFAHVGSIPGYYTCNEKNKLTFIENTIGERFIDVNDFDDLDSLPNLENCAVRYLSSNEKSPEEARELQLKVQMKNPLYVKRGYYGEVKSNDDKEVEAEKIELPTANMSLEAVKKLTTLTQVQMADVYMEDNADDIPILSTGESARNTVLNLIQKYDAE